MAVKKDPTEPNRKYKLTYFYRNLFNLFYFTDQPTKKQDQVAELQQKIDANAVSLSEITDIIEETVALSEVISKCVYSPDPNFAMEMADANAQLVKCAEETAAMAVLLAFVKQEISKF